MTLESSLIFALAVFIFGITPGPGVFAIISRALTQGAGACFFLSVGMIVSDILYLIAACLGLAVIATQFNGVFLIVRIIGAAYLFYLGWKMWTSPIHLSTGESKVSVKNHFLSFSQGFLISASNPKVILFYIAFLPTFMDMTVLDPEDIALASVLTFLSLLAGLSLIAWFAASARKFFESERGAQRLNRGAGAIMVSAGAFLLSKS